MKRRLILSCVLLVLVIGAGSPRAQSQQWVVVDVAGRERVAFVPQREVYTTGAPAVSIPVPAGSQVRLGSGELVQAFEFIGWHEAGAVRVVVRALLPLDPESALPSRSTRSEPDQHERRQIAAMPVRTGETLTVDRLRGLGMPVVELRLVER